MSYCSDNKLPKTAPANRVIEIIELLGYQKVKEPFTIENQTGSYMWLGNDNEISFVGVELSIYKYDDYTSVQTRTRMGRSYWDLKHQNKTISLLHSIFGGSFETDEGKNRYMKFAGEAPSKLSCALYLPRWILHNETIKSQIYLSSCKLTGDIAKKKPTGLSWMDDMKPRVLSHNMLIPYIIACWESYLRQSYIAILKYSETIPERALKNCKASSTELLEVVRKENDLTYVLADSLSFQRPSIAAENLRQLNSRIDIKTWLSAPYHKRKKTLFESITELVEMRNMIVHRGKMFQDFTEEKARVLIDDLAVSADRIYDGFGSVFGFDPNKEY